MSITSKEGEGEKGGRNETYSSYMRSYTLASRAAAPCRKEFVRRTREICSRSQGICAYMCVSASGTRQVARRVWIDSRVLEVNGNRRGDWIFNMLSSCALNMSTFFPLSQPFPSPLPALPSPFFLRNVRRTFWRILVIIRTG